MSETSMPQPTVNQTGKAPEGKKSSITAWLFDSSMKLAIITATLFLAGSFYASAFFAVFGLDVRTLDLPFYSFVSMAFRPVVTLTVFGLNLFSVLLVIVPILTYLFYWYVVIFWEWYGPYPPDEVVDKAQEQRGAEGEEGKQGKQATTKSSGWKEQFEHFAKNLGLLGGIMLIWLLCLASATQLGTSEGESYKKDPPIRACLNFKVNEKAELNDKLRDANSEGKLRVLFQTKDLVVVFTKDGNGVFIVPRANLFSVQNQVISPSKDKADTDKADTDKADATACPKELPGPNGPAR